jgi:hypothetical protein
MRQRPTQVFVFIAALVVGVAVGAGTSCVERKKARCLPSNCEGCCDKTDNCVTLTDQGQDVCGFLGALCRKCTGAQACTNGFCLTYNDAGSIEPGGECGLRGEECCTQGSGCYSGLYCQQGRCVNIPGPGGDDAGAPDSKKAVGAACAAGTECHYGDCATSPFQGGYCTKACQVPADCPTGTACSLDPRDPIGLARVCLTTCTTPGAPGGGCRTGYVCDKHETSLDLTAVCTPSCTLTGNCGFFGTCDSRGVCCGADGFACCEGSTCDIGTTCAAGYCRATGAPNANGAACTEGTQCTGGNCVTEVPAGTDECYVNACWPGGSCTQSCSSQACADGSSCVLQRSPIGGPMCLQNCAFDGGRGDCRTGYVCDKGWVMGGAQAVCMYSCGDPAECPFLTSCQDGFCCGATSYRCCGGVGGTCTGGGTCNASGFCE